MALYGYEHDSGILRVDPDVFLVELSAALYGQDAVEAEQKENEMQREKLHGVFCWVFGAATLFSECNNAGIFNPDEYR